MHPDGKPKTPAERLARSRSVLTPRAPAADREGSASGARADGSSERLVPTGDLLVPATSSAGSTDTLTLGYRDTEFTVPLDWYHQYQEDLAAQHASGLDENLGKVSSTSAFLDYAWSDVRAAAVAATWDEGTWEAMLHCYNLPRSNAPDEMVTLFWHTGWGSPYRAYLYTNLLVMVYAAQIKEVCTAAYECEGLATFVEATLRGLPQHSLVSGELCMLGFRFPNDDSTYGTASADTGSGWFMFDCGEWRLPYVCSEGFLVDRETRAVEVPGQLWNKALPPSRFDSVANEWIPQDPGAGMPGSDRAWTYTETLYDSPRAYVQDGTWHVVQRPELLAWDGFVCDWILYLGRMAYDLARDYTVRLAAAHREALLQAAWELGRYALRILVYRGHTLIHELGHVHNGEGGHCSKGSCCFDLAAQRWECALSALLGLPMWAGSWRADLTWTDTRRAWDRDYCRDGHTMTYAIPDLVCVIDTPGDPGTRWAFGCTNCDLGSTWVWEFWP